MGIGVSTTDLRANEDCSWIKSCGVRLFHVNHEEVQTLSPTHLKNHVANLTDNSVQKNQNYNAFVTKRKMSDRQYLEVKEINKPGWGCEGPYAAASRRPSVL